MTPQSRELVPVFLVYESPQGMRVMQEQAFFTESFVHFEPTSSKFGVRMPRSKFEKVGGLTQVAAVKSFIATEAKKIETARERVLQLEKQMLHWEESLARLIAEGVE